jgi:uncharacterized membrane protein
MASIPGASGSARAITPDGGVIVGEADSIVTQQGFRYFPATNTTILFPNIGTLSYTQGYGVSADGTYVAALLVTPTSGRTAMRWSVAGPVYLTLEPSSATAISADGSVLAGYTFNPSNHSGPAFRWTQAGGLVPLPHVAPVPPLSPVSQATAMTPDGAVIVGWSGALSTAQHAFRWSQATGTVALGAVNGAETLIANAVNADGATIVGSYTGGRAFIWDAINGARDLRDLLLANGATNGLQAWTLQSAQGISADGAIVVGFGLDGQGRTQAFLARVIPAPCYANCDGSSLQPVLNVLDFTCFMNRFAAGDPYANCDGNTDPPILTASDFVCFQSAFAAGCP